ncbi:hypothetical protein BOW65_10965 [Pseudomonas koreensis]|uniref:anti-phage Hailong system nucleotidyltransferase HalB n=1 Tax=Pseudomonas koreensis TaxID=198620 RepID=UPI00098562B0|nr:nucleotidyltransferase domain-containing protein [Pseudomonas koreensis]OOH80392.1 hypothetical protein BOW65_10965 [Pseudomonas koreensis]
MAILALALYGSRARGDSNEHSDIDFFAITDDSDYKMMVTGNTNIACYPLSLAVERAKDGDLFVLHICLEAKELYSTNSELSDLRDLFQYKNDYEREISMASDLAWFLVESGSNFRNFTLLNKRIAWCVRTILIAKSAEARSAVFSSLELAKFSGTSRTAKLIQGKNETIFRPELIRELALFLQSFGKPKPNLSGTSKIDGYAWLFAQSENIMGLKTLQSIQGDATSENYT